MGKNHRQGLLFDYFAIFNNHNKKKQMPKRR